MNKTTLTFLLAILSLSFYNLSAQHTHVACGHQLMMQEMEQNYPGYQDAVRQTFEEAKRVGTANKLNRSSMVYTIPVVVHVVWKETDENISDDLIKSQIDVLNEDYRRLNADAGNIRPLFADVVGDAMIEFELKEIKRVETTEDFKLELTGGLPDNVKVTAEGGSDALDTETHLNIWICHIQPINLLGFTLGQILGYAYPPAGLDNWPEGVTAPSPELDGVVLDYRTIGRENPFDIDLGLGAPLETQGRTATHEVGHYLGLRHAWGDGGDPFDVTGMSDSCDADDGVEDTPNTGGQANFDCDPTRNSCEDSTDDLPDMIENYMDYAAESCMNSFTNGQINIMRGVLESQRCALVNACNATSVATIDQSHLLRAFPNPTAHTLTLQLDNDDLVDFDLSIHNLLGKQMATPIFNGHQQIDLSALSNGVYFLTLKKDNIQMVKKISVLK